MRKCRLGSRIFGLVIHTSQHQDQHDQECENRCKCEDPFSRARNRKPGWNVSCLFRVRIDSVERFIVPRLFRRCGLHPGEGWHVSAAGNLDSHGICGAGHEIVALETTAHARRLDPDDGIILWVEALVAVEGSDSNGKSLYPMPP